MYYPSLPADPARKASTQPYDVLITQMNVQVIRLAELDTLKNSLVGLPGSSGLTVEQRKRLTIAVELVANPSERSPCLLQPQACALDIMTIS